MKRIIYLILTAFLIISCSQPQQNEETNPTQENTTTNEDVISNVENYLNENADTLSDFKIINEDYMVTLLDQSISIEEPTYKIDVVNVKENIIEDSFQDVYIQYRFYGLEVIRLKTIDNGLMLDVFAWIIAIKSIILQGVIVSLGDTNTMWNATNEFKSLLLIIGFGSLILLYGFTTIIQLNVPNLRNTAITIPTIAFAIITALFVVLFSGFLYKPGQSDKSSISNWVFVFMPLVITIGISISLIIKICIVAKIFKTEWKEPVVIDNSDIAKEQAQETNDFIGERTEAFDLDQIEKNKESIKSGKDNESVKELRDAIKESQREV